MEGAGVVAFPWECLARLPDCNLCRWGPIDRPTDRHRPSFRKWHRARVVLQCGESACGICAHCTHSCLPSFRSPPVGLKSFHISSHAECARSLRLKLHRNIWNRTISPFPLSPLTFILPERGQRAGGGNSGLDASPSPPPSRPPQTASVLSAKPKRLKSPLSSPKKNQLDFPSGRWLS